MIYSGLIKTLYSKTGLRSSFVVLKDQPKKYGLDFQRETMDLMNAPDFVNKRDKGDRKTVANKLS